VREAILLSLGDKLKHGDKGLVGNAGYRRFLATPRDDHFEIDPDRVAEDARFDGIYVLRTNTKLDTLSVALAYRQLWRVDIDQAWRLLRLCGGMIGGERRRSAAPGRGRRANRLKLCDGRRVGVHQFDRVTPNRHLAAA